MSTTPHAVNAILIVAIVLVAYYLYTQKAKSEPFSNPTAGRISIQQLAGSSVTHAGANMDLNAAVLEAERGFIHESTENFAGGDCVDTQLGPPVGPCDCAAGSTFPYATNAFGGVDKDFTTWVKDQSIDPTVVANHKEFITDRTSGGSGVNIMGRTFTPADSHQSYTPGTTWIGIRGRPSMVPICNPDQVPDVNFGYFPKHQKLNWDSSSTYAV
jgi:hypothetical protein